MKIVMVEFPDTTDISTLVVGQVTTVGAVTGGTIIQTGTIQNPPAPTLVQHSHTIPNASGTVAIPGGITGQTP